MKRVMLVKYGEISLRKGNRAYFEHGLLDAIRGRLNAAGENTVKVSREQGRFLIEDTEDLRYDKILPHIKNIFGIAGFCYAAKTTERDLDKIGAQAHEFFSGYMKGKNAATFKVQTKRSDKNYPHTSMEVSAAVGEVIFSSGLGLGVDLKQADITLWVEIRNEVYFYVDAVQGVGGLPYGASGKGVLLLSGGFDSPVAGYLTARRGVEIVAAYCHSPPFVSERAREKVCDIARRLADFAGSVTLYVVPFTELQTYLNENVPLEKLTIFLKRAMLKVAEGVAEREKAQCLITGDAIGQVASQTIQSMAAMESAVSLPIIRPLAAMDKQDIINISHKIEMYDISVRPYEDCCTVFVAKHPENKPNRSVIEKMEAKLDLQPLIQKAVEASEIVMYN